MTAPTRRLIIMRHAKSSWKDPGLADHQRPLNKRGRRDAPRMGRALRQRGWLPDQALSSDSARTRETWTLAAQELDPGGQIPVAWLPSFYHGGAREVLDRLAQLPGEVGTALVLGHNPGWEALTALLCGVPVTLKTASAALLEASGTWPRLALPGAWDLAAVLHPAEV